MTLEPTPPSLQSTPPSLNSPTATAPASSAPASSALGTRVRNTLIALTAVILVVLIFFGLRTQTQVPTLASLVGRSLPLEEALANERPTLIEFYADWCTSCQAMVPTVAAIEEEYGDRLNVVMLNVDNDKWLPEVLRYHVDGIPHFEFLDGQGQAIAATLGQQPRSMMAANVAALLTGDRLPYAKLSGQTSSFEAGLGLSAGATDPRSHGNLSPGPSL